jgi:hypothetical protein
MPNPWLLALKVIPWGDVIEHAPKVLSAARKLVDRQREQKRAPPGADLNVATATDGPAPSTDQLQARLQAAHDRIDGLLQAQDQLTQTVADLAEQNARLVAAVNLLRLRTRLLMAATALGAVALIALWLR